jgi:hypothetical protein
MAGSCERDMNLWVHRMCEASQLAEELLASNE